MIGPDRKVDFALKVWIGIRNRAAVPSWRFETVGKINRYLHCLIIRIILKSAIHHKGQLAILEKVSFDCILPFLFESVAELRRSFKLILDLLFPFSKNSDNFCKVVTVIIGT